MRIGKFLKELDKFDVDVKIKLHMNDGPELAGIMTNRHGFVVLVDKQDAKTNYVKNNLIVANTAIQLKNAIRTFADDNAKITIDSVYGSEAFYVLHSDKYPNTIWIEGEDDVNLHEKINAVFEYAMFNGEDELNVYSQLLEIGITPSHVTLHFGINEGEHMAEFCKSHGLM